MVKKNGIISQIVENIKTGISNSWPKIFVKIPASLLVNLPKSKESLSRATLFELLKEILQQSMSRASYRYRCRNKLQICPVFQAGRSVLHPTWMLPCEMPFIERNRRSYKTPMLHSTHHKKKKKNIHKIYNIYKKHLEFYKKNLQKFPPNHVVSTYEEHT